MKKKKSKRSSYSILQNVIFLMKDIKKEHPSLLPFCFIQIILSVISPVFSIYIPKVTLDLVQKNASVSEIFFVLGLLGLIMTLSMAISGMVDEGKYMMYNDMRRYYQMKLFFQSLSCDYKYVESEEGHTTYQRAISSLFGGDGSGTSVMIVSVISLIVNTLCFILYSGIISTLNLYVIFLLIVLSFISFYSTKYAQTYEHDKENENANFEKKLNYMIYTGSNIAFGKDMRLYQAGKWFVNLRNSLIQQFCTLNRKIRKRYFNAGVVNAFVLFLRDGIAYAYLIYAVTTKKLRLLNLRYTLARLQRFQDLSMQ